MWRKENPCALLVGMYIDTNSIKYLKKKTKIKLPSNPTPGHIHYENHNSKGHITAIFIAALFTIARTWEQPECLLTDKCIEKR